MIILPARPEGENDLAMMYVHTYVELAGGAGDGGSWRELAGVGGRTAGAGGRWREMAGDGGRLAGDRREEAGDWREVGEGGISRLCQ